MLVFTNAKGETCVPFFVFKGMPLKNVMKAIEENRKVKK